eukprot:5211867-Pyramimonas_sp.AAC.1
MCRVFELRAKLPPDRWSELAENMIRAQQPSGFVGKVIMTWHVELRIARCPCSLGQRDLFARAC